MQTSDEVKRYIDDLDFSMIIKKMTIEQGWQKKKVMEVSEYYRHFLFLIYKYGTKFPNLPPSFEIDEFWHNHILDTKKYCEDCQNIFGRYIHHNPYTGMDGKTSENETIEQFNTLQKLHFQEFGSYIYKIKKRNFFYNLKYLCMLGAKK